MDYAALSVLLEQLDSRHEAEERRREESQDTNLCSPDCMAHPENHTAVSLPGTSEGGKGEKAPEVAGPSAPPKSAPGEKAAEWTVVARHKKKVAARSTGEAKQGETKPTAAPSGGGSGGVPDKETPSTAPPARQGGKAARKTKQLTPGGEEREAAGGELPVAATRLGTASGSIRGKRKAQARLYRPHGGGP
ncbi:UNVERIFIED_CONTAM: hypothetical protein FKN15_058569 [Acipenser sinensis]